MKLKYSSLLTKFLVILILIALFNVLNFVFLEKIIAPAVSDRILKENLSIVNHLVLHTKIIIDEAIDSLLITAQSSDIRSLEKEKISSTLTKLAVSVRTDFRETSVINKSGQELMRVSSDKLYFPSDFRNFENNEEFKKAIRGEIYISQPFFDDPNRPDLPFLTIMVPIESYPGNFIGVLAGKLGLAKVLDLVTTEKVGESGNAYLVDGQGKVLAHIDGLKAIKREDFSGLSIIRKVTNGQNGIETFINENGEETLGAYAFYEPLGWGIVAQQPAKEAFAPVVFFVNRSIILTIFFTVLSLVLAAAIFRIILLNPIANLKQGLLRFGAGKLASRVKIKSRDEIGDLAESFNQMAEKLMVSTQSLEKEKDQTSAIVSSLGDGLVMYNPKGEINFLNPKAEEILWISKNDVLGKSLENKYFFNTSLLKNFYDISTLHLKNWETKEYTIEGPKKAVLQITHIILKGPQKNNLGYMRVLHDITREKEVEAIKSEFVSLASHQLRTPLSAMKWSLDMLFEGSYGKLTSGQKEIIRKIFGSNERLIQLVNDLLDVSRIEEGRFGYSFSLESPEIVVDKIVSKFSDKIRENKLQFSFEKPKTALPKVSIDGDKLEMAIENLIDNAVKYTPSGGKIKIYFKITDSDYLTVFVEDTGIGVPENQQHRVFDKFFRADNAVKFQTEGSGLGLYIAQNIIKSHRGKINFKSQEGKGSIFYFTLPINPRLMPEGKIGAGG